VFIPGAKVAADAYLYKLSGAVEKDGLTVVITKPILNLAFFDQRSLGDFTSDARGIHSWYVGGHSLGGVRACQYADQPKVTGLILFGSYCANDLSARKLAVLSIGGSTDGLSTPSKIKDAAALLPADATFVQIAGSNHARFGDYGVQAGDGTATVSTSKVQRVITRDLTKFLAGR
ncbi:MAG: alpha/beta hydrolase, partial [Lacisediminihabitans sp.]